MPLSLDNDLPSTVLRFGSLDDNEIIFSCHLDNFILINTGHSLLHMWIMTNYLETVESYDCHDDTDEFQPITLDCFVPSSAAEKDAIKLSDVVTYKTRYHDKNGKMITLSFGLGEAISINTIIGLSTFRGWKIVYVDDNKAAPKSLNQYIDLSFQHAASGLPPGAIFQKEDFI